MPRYARKEIPPGFMIQEDGPRSYTPYRLQKDQAGKEIAVPIHSSFTKRYTAVCWCLKTMGEELLGMPAPSKPYRLSIPDEVKAAIFLQQSGKCKYCDVTLAIPACLQGKVPEPPDGAEYELDHVLALSKGGNNEPENLAYACKSCNSHKHTLDVSAFLARMGAGKKRQRR
jgi:hypothetical protein